MNDPCEKMRDKVVDYVLGVPNRWEIDSIDKHLRRCAACTEYAELLQNEKRSLLQFGQKLDTEMSARQARVIQALQGASGKEARLLSIWRIVMQSRITRFAAAAVMILAVLVAVKMLAGSDKKPSGEIASQHDTPQEQVTVEIQEETTQGRDEELRAKLIAKELEAELQDAEQMFAARDVAGLVDTLAKGKWDTKVAVANYLAKIGDLSAIDALGSLVGQWRGDTADNPFATAISEIAARLGEDEEETQQADAAEGETANGPATATMPQQKKTIVFKGVVTNKAGDPIEGTIVRSDLTYYAQFMFAGGEAYSSADSQGLFQIGPLPELDRKTASRTLVFDHPDYAIGWFNPRRSDDVDPNSVAITLLEPSFVVGRIVDGEGSAVAEATVEADIQMIIDRNYYYYSLGGMNRQAVTTDAAGYFAFERIPNIARLHIRVTKRGHANYSTRDEYPGDAYPIRAGREDLVITVKPGVSVNGRLVFDGSDYKKDGIIIFAGGAKDRCWGKTDQDGRFEILGLAEGTYTFNVDDGYLRKAGLSCAPIADFQTRLDQPTPYIEFTLQEGLPVTVKAVDKNTGEPIRGIWIRATLPDNKQTSVASGNTDDKGNCVMRLTKGDYVLLAQGWKNGELRQFSRDFSVKADGEQSNVEIEVQSRPMIWGWLADVNDNPVRGTVTLGSESVESDEHGEFAMPEPWGGGEGIHVGYASDVDKKLGSGFFWKQSEDVNDLRIILLPLANAAGRIVDTDGQGAGDVRPQIGIALPHGGSRFASRNPWKTRMEADGRFSFEYVPVGLPMKMYVEKPGYYGGTDLFELVPGETLELGEIVLKPKHGFEDGQTDWTGTLSGRVTNENGKPMRGLRVWANGADGPSQDSTDRKGRFKLDKLPRGKRVSGAVYADGYGHTSFKRVIDGNDFDIQIFPQGWELLGKPAPELLVEKWLNTEPVTLEQYRARVVLLQIGILLPDYSRHFERIENALEKYGAKGLAVIAVHEPLRVTWAGKVTEKDIRAFIGKNKIEFPFGIDDSSYDANTRSAYDLKATPALYLIDKDGIVRVSPKKDDLDKWIKKLLAE